jgi:hypothetical protein
MSGKKVATDGIQLDEHGRAVLDDELLDAISRHDLDIPIAGGSNAACPNSGCTNYGCDNPGQVNSNCTNRGCGANLNNHCTNQREIDPGGGGE